MTASVGSNEHEGSIELPDGRTLAYAALGADSGPVVVVLDGPGSRGLARAADVAAKEVGARLIAPDRPGFGRSTAQARRTIMSWPADLAALADSLGLDSFGLLGQSGGTPFALASAEQMPGRVRAVSLTGAIFPLGEKGALEGVKGPMRVTFVLAKRAPWALRPLLQLAARQARRDPERFAERAIGDLPAADRAVLAAPRMMEIHVRTTAEIMSAPAEFAHEARLFARPWGFDFGDVRVPVALWAGDRDTTHPPSMSRRLAQLLPQSDLEIVHDASTFGLAGSYPAALRFASGSTPVTR